MSSQHFKLTRPGDDYGPEVVHIHVGGRTLILKRGESDTFELTVGEEGFIRDLKARYELEEVPAPAPKAPADPALASFLAGGSVPTKTAPPSAPSPPSVAKGGEEAKAAQSPPTILTPAAPAASPVKEA